MTATEGPVHVAVLVEEGLFRASLRHALARTGVSVSELGASRPVSSEPQRDPVPVAVLIEVVPGWLSVEEGMARARRAHPSSALILLVDRASPRQVEAWLSAGCRAVIWKEAHAHEVGLAIDAVRCGVPFVSVDVCPHLSV